MAIGIFPIALILFLIVYFILRAIFGKGKPVLSEPYCAKCNYDLRVNWDSSMACPECGADLKAKNAVNFGKVKKSRPWMTVGITLLVLFILLSTLSLFAGITAPRRVATGPAAVATLPNNNLIGNLPTVIDEPWTIRELESRYGNNKLTADEVDQMLSQLITGLKTKPLNERGPLHWSREFMQQLIDDDAISSKRFNELVKVYFGPGPTRYQPITSKMQPGWSAIHVSYTQTWPLGTSNNTRPHCKLVSVVKEGDEQTPMLFVPEAHTHWNASQVKPLDELPISFVFGSRVCLKNTLDPGEHVLLLTVITELYPKLTAKQQPTESDKPVASITHIQPIKVSVDASGRIISEKLNIK